MQIQEALARSILLEDISESARVDVELILCHLLKKPRSYLFTWPDRTLTDIQRKQFEQLLARRLKGEPVAHITGLQGFWSLNLEVSPDTLIPRPDTEVLVETALRVCGERPMRVADLGTGTGAIALALAVERPSWQVVASDFVAAAAELAERNRQRLDVPNMQTLHGSWFEPHQGKYGLIVSNPPYIDPDDPHLQKGDVRFEPLTALTADANGLADIALICTQARDFLEAGGWLMIEHGYDQGLECRSLFKKLGYSQVDTVLDYGQNERVTLGCWADSAEGEKSC